MAITDIYNPQFQSPGGLMGGAGSLMGNILGIGGTPASYNMFNTGRTQNTTANQQIDPYNITDPITGRSFSTAGLGVGAGPASDVIQRGFGLDTMAEQRRQQSMGLVGNYLNTLQQQYQNPLSGINVDYINRLVGMNIDQAGMAKQANTSNLASMLGARGITTNSPMAAGLAQQTQMQYLQQINQGQRDIGIEAVRQASTQRLAALQQQQGAIGMLSNLTMQVPQYGYESLQGLSELMLQKQYIDAAAKAGKQSSKNSLIGSILGGIGGIVGGLL